MQVKRIVANIEAYDLAKAKAFYGDLLGLDEVMNLGWIATYGSEEKMSVQINAAIDGGSNIPTPDLSIEVDDLEEALWVMKEAGV